MNDPVQTPKTPFPNPAYAHLRPLESVNQALQSTAMTRDKQAAALEARQIEATVEMNIRALPPEMRFAIDTREEELLGWLEAGGEAASCALARVGARMARMVADEDAL